MPMIDRVDSVLAQHCSLMDEELRLMTRYEIKYRMGASDGNED